MWNPLKKNNDEEEKALPNIPGMPARNAGGVTPAGWPDMKDLNMFQRFAMKRMMKMSPAEREKMMKKAMTPKNIAKNKTEILASLEAMRKSGQISDDQYRLTKKKMGI